MRQVAGHAGAISDELVGRLAGELRSRVATAATRAAVEPESGWVAEAAHGLVAEHALLLPASQREAIVERLIAETMGLGPIEPLLADPEIDEVMVVGPERVYVERRGRIELAGARFESAEALQNVIERVLARVGRRVDEAVPLADARLPDGSRVNCVIPPVTLSGELLTIRKFRRRGFTARDLVANGTLEAALCDLLAACVKGKANMVVSGGTGSGKTTTLNALSGFIPAGERVITVEDAAELRLQQPHVLRLESRPANVEGRGEITIRALVRNSLRMRPDRIIVGEVRGGEALDMLQAMNTGHEGSLTTLHANSPGDAVRRVETLALMADVDLPHHAIGLQVASAVDLVIHQERGRDGRRQVVEVAEIVGDGGETRAVPLYRRHAGGPAWPAPPSERLATKIAAGGGAPIAAGNP